MPHKADFIEAETFLVKHPAIDTIDLLIADMNGVLRGKRIRRDGLSKAYRDGICLPGALFAFTISGDTVQETGLGFDEGDADRPCWPLPGTLKAVPWQEQPSAQVLLSMHEADGRPFFGDPRHVLTTVLERFASLKLTPVVAVELEFYLMDRERTVQGGPQPPISPVTGSRMRAAQVYGMDEIEDHSSLLDAILHAAEKQDIPATAAVAEYAPGQYEINLHHVADPLLACDYALMMKRLIKGVAHRHGLEATFMAKPYDEHAGSGMHAHISLQDDSGHNVFAFDQQPNPLLRHALGGLSATMGECMALFAPNANSYRRFQAESYVPLSPSWSYNNRTTALRIPFGPAQATRIEHRVAGADANPYLLIAALLAGIHHGIVGKLEPGAPTVGNAYAQQPPSLPIDWGAALQALEQSAVAADYLGQAFCRIYCVNKYNERAAFARRVTPLEYEWYLRTV